MSISLDPPLDTELDTAPRTGCQALDTTVLDEAVLIAIATGLAEVSTPWDLRPGDAPDERHYERLLTTETYDAWLIYWPSATGLDLHDHGGSAGAFALVDGVLDEARPIDRGTIVRRLGQGDSASFGPTQIHGVSNTGDQPATSVHVYSPPLASMRYYAQTGDGSVDELFDSVGWDTSA